MASADDLKRSTKRFLQRLGIEAARHDRINNDLLCLVGQLEEFCIDLVIDVGANIGDYAVDLFRSGYRGRVVSIEPQSNTHEILVQRSSRETRWEVYDRCCLGDRDGEAEINISGNSVASSLLPLTDRHTKASPDARYTGRETVSVCRLDTIFSEIGGPESRTFLKIDVQGYEASVLDGARESLDQVLGMQIELSLVPIYEDQVLLPDLLVRLDRLGYEVVRFFPAFVDQESGRWLAADVLCFRREASTYVECPLRVTLGKGFGKVISV